MGHALYEASVEASKPDGERETAYRQRNAPFMVKRLAKRLTDVHPPHEAALLRRAVASGVLKLPLGLLPADGEAIEALATQLEDGTITTGSIATMDAAELASVIEGTTPPPLDDVAPGGQHARTSSRPSRGHLASRLAWAGFLAGS